MKNKLLLTLLTLGVSGAAFAVSPVPSQQEGAEKPKFERKCNPESGDKEKCGPRHGAPGEGRHGKKWEHLDTNKDGKISREEAQNAEKNRFEKLDKNKDGFITKEEMREMHRDHPRPPRQEGKGERPMPQAEPNVVK